MIKNKLVAFIGTANNNGLINSYAHIYADFKWELKVKLMDFYKDTFWQQFPDDIAVYPIVTESNGYQHCGEKMFQVTSQRFWAK